MADPGTAEGPGDWLLPNLCDTKTQLSLLFFLIQTPRDKNVEPNSRNFMIHHILLEKHPLWTSFSVDSQMNTLEFAERWVLIVTSGKRDFTQQNKSSPPGTTFDVMWRWPCCSAPSARSLRVYLDRLPKTVSQVSRCWTNSFNSVTIRGFRSRCLMNTYCSSGCLHS